MTLVNMSHESSRSVNKTKQNHVDISWGIFYISQDTNGIYFVYQKTQEDSHQPPCIVIATQEWLQLPLIAAAVRY